MEKKKMVKVSIELDDDVLFWLFMEAHKKNITLNALVNKLLEVYLDKLEAEEKTKKTTINKKSLK